MIKLVYDFEDAIKALNDLENEANTNDYFGETAKAVIDFLELLPEIIRYVEEAKETIENLERSNEDLESKVKDLVDDIALLELAKESDS